MEIRSLSVLRRVFGMAMLWLLVAGYAPLARSADTLLPFQSGWSYVDYGFSPGADWYGTNFQESNWKFNYGKFGYGYGDEQTLINYGPNSNDKFITTYFRTWISVNDAGQYTTLTFNLRRDDGVVVYVNGSELFRNNMPATSISNSTFAAGTVINPADAAVVANFPASVFHDGLNLIAAEVHQASVSSPDLAFDLEITAENSGGPQVIRGPYLQVGTSSNIVVRWRTDQPTDTRVRYGTNASALNRAVTSGAVTTEHEITLTGLSPSTRYYYEVGTTAIALAFDGSYTFTTAPAPGTVQPIRIWAIGDFGTGFPTQFAVRDAYAAYSATRPTDVWLMLGDNAYDSGQDEEYQSYVFNAYPEMLRQVVAWPTVGNHDTAQSQLLSDDFPYYNIFTLPTQGEAGGVASGTEHYYSFDYGNVHFICLDSMTAAFRQPDSAMANWLRADLSETTRDWIIAYWHHPAYTRGTHNSDFESELIQMRQNILPILEEGGVDMVLCGHSHNYERSYLLDGHYGFSSSLNPTNIVSGGSGRTDESETYLKPAQGMGSRRGTVYITDGSSGGQGTFGSVNHPAMFYASHEYGSVVIDINGQRLDASFIRSDGAIPDYFTIDKGNGGFNATNAPPALEIRRGAGTNILMSWRTSLPDFRLESKPALRSAIPWQPVARMALTNGRTKSVVVPAGMTNEFFQLKSAP